MLDLVRVFPGVLPGWQRLYSALVLRRRSLISMCLPELFFYTVIELLQVLWRRMDVRVVNVRGD